MRICLLAIVMALAIQVRGQVPVNLQTDAFIDKTKIDECLGKPFPSFLGNTLEGIPYSEKDLTGKITVVYFWFEMCSPCLAEFDALNDLYRTYSKNPKFQFISFTSDSPAEAKESVKKHGLLFPVLCAPEEECFRLNCRLGFPTTIILDSTGKILSIKTGGSVDRQESTDEIQKIGEDIGQFLAK